MEVRKKGELVAQERGEDLEGSRRLHSSILEGQSHFVVVNWGRGNEKSGHENVGNLKDYYLLL